MSEPEETKEDVPSTLTDGQQQEQEKISEKKSESNLQPEENNLNDGDKTEPDKKIQEDDENAPAVTPDQDNVEGDFFDESKATDENEPKEISGMTKESESESKEEIAGENQVSEEAAISKVPEDGTVENTLTPRPSEVRRSQQGSKLSARKSIGSNAKLQEESHGSITSGKRMSRIRPSISYAEMGPRIQAGNEDDDLIGFDMGVSGPMILFDDIVEEEEQTIVIEEQELSKLDREPYYERHDKAMAEIAERKTRNLILQKKLAMYFKRKKMDYVTKEMEWSYDQQNKYNNKLEAYGELMELDVNERTRINEEIREAKETRDKRFQELNKMFTKMQNSEAETGYGLIYHKTGTVISDKLVNRLLKRQNAEMEQISNMRLTYIKLKQMVQEKLDAINDINEVAPGLFLADYEQLKTINQSYADKLEEKDEELTRLRSKCSSTTQTLAHLREKTAALENDHTDLVQERRYINYNYSDIRSNLNHTKQQRDSYRHNINRIRDDSGLLTQPTLLRDMEEGLTDAKELQANVDHLTGEYRKREKHLEVIRQKIEEAKELRRSQKYAYKIKNVASTQLNTVNEPENIYKRRPTLMMPVILDNEFECLKSIKPLITKDRRKNNKFTPHM